MASSISTLVSPPTISTVAASAPTSPTPPLVLPINHTRVRRFGPRLARASPSAADYPDGTTPKAPSSPDRVKLAFAKATAYRKTQGEQSLNPVPEENPVGKTVPFAVERGRELGENEGVGVETPVVNDGLSERAGGLEYNQSADAEPIGVPDGDHVVPDPMKLAMERDRKHKEDRRVVDETGGVSEGSGEVGPGVPDSVKLAMERAREYKKNKGAVGGDGDVAERQPMNTGLEKTKLGNTDSTVVDNKVQKPGELKVSSLDFLGLDFSEKKNRGVPAGLVPVADTFSDGDVPEVEIIVGDASKFKSSAPSKLNLNEVDENVGLYKPKVSTWGVFPRPSNISETFGGGRNIRPGEMLESAEVKAAKEEQTKQLIANYKSKIGLTIDAKMKAECEKALTEGDHLMDIGKLQEALPYYEKIMKNLAFQTELHGTAALQWSICQDSLRRPNDARVVYERLQSHPNVNVRKTAKQFMFGFQAMEMMKVASYPIPKTTGYENYFDAFVEDNANYSPTPNANYSPTPVEQDESGVGQVLPYLIFLISPVVIVLAIAIRKSLEF